MPITKATQRVIDGITSTGGNTSRLLQDRFSDVTNVKDFGAVGNGVADDTAAIQAALLAAGTTKTVLIPDGNYVVTASCVAYAPVILDGFLTITSPTVKFQLKSQPIVLSDYRKIYMGSNWSNGGADCGLALQRAIDELLVSFKYYTLDGEGWVVGLKHEIICDPPASGFYGQFKNINNMMISLQSGFGDRNSTTGVITANANAYTFNIIGTQPAAAYGIIFNKVNIYCQKRGNGINFNFSDNNQESKINGCHITNFYRVAITSNHPIRINDCEINGGDFDLNDADRTITGIELFGGDSEILASTINYCKTGIHVTGGTLFVSSCHIFNGSTQNVAPNILVQNNTADLRVDSCYIDNGPIIIDDGGAGFNTFGRVAITNCLLTWGGDTYGKRSYVIARPRRAAISIRGIIVSNCQFRDFRIFGRTLDYTGDGITTTFTCPVTDQSDARPAICSTTSGSNLITVESTALYWPHLKVTGTGIPSNTVIDEIVDSQTLRLNNNATATSSSVSLTFSETLQVRVNGLRVYNWTLSSIAPGQTRTQTITFTTPPPSGQSIQLYSKYFAAIPFDVDNTYGSINENDAWDIHIENNSYYSRTTSTGTDLEPLMKQSSRPMIQVPTTNSLTEYAVDWNWSTPFRINPLQIESIGWRCGTTTYVAPPVIGYNYINEKRGTLKMASAATGISLIKGNINTGDESIV